MPRRNIKSSSGAKRPRAYDAHGGDTGGGGVSAPESQGEMAGAALVELPFEQTYAAVIAALDIEAPEEVVLPLVHRSKPEQAFIAALAKHVGWAESLVASLPFSTLLRLACAARFAGNHHQGSTDARGRPVNPGLRNWFTATDAKTEKSHSVGKAVKLVGTARTLCPGLFDAPHFLNVESLRFLTEGVPALMGVGFPSALMAWVVRLGSHSRVSVTAMFARALYHRRRLAGVPLPVVKPLKGNIERELCWWIEYMLVNSALLQLDADEWVLFERALAYDRVPPPPMPDRSNLHTYLWQLIAHQRNIDGEWAQQYAPLLASFVPFMPAAPFNTPVTQSFVLQPLPAPSSAFSSQAPTEAYGSPRSASSSMYQHSEFTPQVHDSAHAHDDGSHITFDHHHELDEYKEQHEAQAEKHAHSPPFTSQPPPCPQGSEESGIQPYADEPASKRARLSATHAAEPLPPLLQFDPAADAADDACVAELEAQQQCDEASAASAQASAHEVQNQKVSASVAFGSLCASASPPPSLSLLSAAPLQKAIDVADGFLRDDYDDLSLPHIHPPSHLVFSGASAPVRR